MLVPHFFSGVTQRLNCHLGDLPSLVSQVLEVGAPVCKGHLRLFSGGNEGPCCLKVVVAAGKYPAGYPNQHWSWAMICDHFCDSNPVLC